MLSIYHHSTQYSVLSTQYSVLSTQYVSLLQLHSVFSLERVELGPFNDCHVHVMPLTLTAELVESIERKRERDDNLAIHWVTLYFRLN